jgi:hypothetical protein
LKPGVTSHFFHGTGADRLFPIMRTNVQVRTMSLLLRSCFMNVL